MWLKIEQEGLRRFWSMFPLTRVPFWYRFFEPLPNMKQNILLRTPELGHLLESFLCWYWAKVDCTLPPWFFLVSSWSKVMVSLLEWNVRLVFLSIHSGCERCKCSLVYLVSRLKTGIPLMILCMFRCKLRLSEYVGC